MELWAFDSNRSRGGFAFSSVFRALSTDEIQKERDGSW